MDFTVCLDGKVPQQFNLLILFYAFGGMLIPFVTALNSIFLAHLPMNDPSNNIMPLFIFCLRKLGATTQHMLHSFIVATTHSAFGWYILAFDSGFKKKCIIIIVIIIIIIIITLPVIKMFLIFMSPLIQKMSAEN